jgi:hypothetical protein
MKWTALVLLAIGLSFVLRRMLSAEPEGAIILLIVLIVASIPVARRLERQIAQGDLIAETDGTVKEWLDASITACRRAITRFGFYWAALYLSFFVLFGPLETPYSDAYLQNGPDTVYELLAVRHFGIVTSQDGVKNFEFRDTQHEIGYWVMILLPIAIGVIVASSVYQRFARRILELESRKFLPVPS